VTIDWCFEGFKNWFWALSFGCHLQMQGTEILTVTLRRFLGCWTRESKNWHPTGSLSLWLNCCWEGRPSFSIYRHSEGTICLLSPALRSFEVYFVKTGPYQYDGLGWLFRPCHLADPFLLNGVLAQQLPPPHASSKMLVFVHTQTALLGFSIRTYMHTLIYTSQSLLLFDLVLWTGYSRIVFACTALHP
jgi:hypothetical protein